MANHHRQNGVHLERDTGDPHENVKLKVRETSEKKTITDYCDMFFFK